MCTEYEPLLPLWEHSQTYIALPSLFWWTILNSKESRFPTTRCNQADRIENGSPRLATTMSGLIGCNISSRDHRMRTWRIVAASCTPRRDIVYIRSFGKLAQSGRTKRRRSDWRTAAPQAEHSVLRSRSSGIVEDTYPNKKSLIWRSIIHLTNPQHGKLPGYSNTFI